MVDPEQRQAKHNSRPFAPASVLPDPSQKKTPWLWIGIGGAIVFICIIAALLVSLMTYRKLNADNTDISGNITPTSQNTITETAQSVVIEKGTNIAVTTPTNVPETVTSKPTNNPVFGKICFKPTTDTGEILDCTTSFPPNVIEVHAVFDYSGLAPIQHSWSRIWFHNSEEVLRVEEDWSGNTEAQFDYNLNTNDGEPLSPGTWRLELYIDGVLQSQGSFAVIVPPTPTPDAPPSPTPVPIAKYKLAFTKWDGSKHSVWTVNLDGTNQQFLLDYAASPSWSPDGTQLAFYGEQGIDHQAATANGTDGIWTMGAHGEAPKQLLPEGSGHVVTWSPDGEIIAFDATHGSPSRRVYFVSPEGSSQPFEALGEHPSFSPTGRQMAVKVCRPDCGIWIQNPDDGNPRRLTNEGSDGLPAWSPDGKKIAFSRSVDGNVDIYTIDIDGSNLQRLTTATGNDSVPTWTPDSQQIVFRSTRNGVWQIFIMRADGSNQRMVVDKVDASDEWAFDRMSVK